MVGAAGRKYIDSSGFDRLSWIIGSKTYWNPSHGHVLRPLPTFYGRRKRFPWIPTSYMAPGYWWLSFSGTQPIWWGCPQEGVLPLLGTTDHYLGHNTSKDEHRTVRVPPNHPMSSLFCNTSKSCCGGYTESALEQHNESLIGHTI